MVLVREGEAVAALAVVLAVVFRHAALVAKWVLLNYS
jgi:hypothetical protein